MKIDLHIHTNNSDGSLTTEQLFKLASKQNIKVISITDHDYIDSYEYLGKKYNILTIPGIEFNTSHKKMHILGYGIKNIEYLKKYMYDLSKQNESICFKLIDILKKEGFDIDDKKIEIFCIQNNIKINCLNKKIIVKYLIYKGYTNNVKETYDMLIGRNAPFYCPIIKLNPKEVIDLIDKVGGISVLAHPATIEGNKNDEINKLVKFGLKGIEIVNLSCIENKEKAYEKIINENNLISTYGSDFHEENQKIGIELNDENTKKLVKKLGGYLC